MQSVGNRHSGAPTGCRGCRPISLISLWIFASLTNSCWAERTNVGEFKAARQNILVYTKNAILKRKYQIMQKDFIAVRNQNDCATKTYKIDSSCSMQLCEWVGIWICMYVCIVSECMCGYFYAPTKCRAQQTVEKQHRFISCGEFGAFACFVWTLRT